MAAPPGSATFEYFLPRSAKMTFSAAPNGVLTWAGELSVLTLSPGAGTSINSDLHNDGTNTGLIVAEAGAGQNGYVSSGTFSSAKSQRILVGVVLAYVSGFTNFDFGPCLADNNHCWRWSTAQNSAALQWGASNNFNFTPANDAAAHRYILDINGASSVVYMDGVSAGSGTLASDTAAGPYGLGGTGAFANNSQGKISWGASAILVASIGTLPSIAALDAWLQAPFGTGGQFDTATFASGGIFDTATFDTKNFAI
jgi:hypothetical protein